MDSSVFGVEDLLYLYYDDEGLFTHFADVILAYVDLFRQEYHIAEVKRDCEAAKENDLRGLNLTTAGSINNGSSLESMRVVMAAIQNYGRY